MLGNDVSTDSLPWLRIVRSGVAIDEAGLRFRGGPRLSRMANGLALAENRERVMALLSVAYRRPMSEASIDHTNYWRHGDKALANPRLVFAGLPPIDQPGDAARFRAAEWLLDEGSRPAP